ncbi:hypothetical protein Tco_1539393 [Tanacetum coccineum]
MVEEDIQDSHKTKEQIRQEQAGLEEAIKLQAQLDAEVAKQIYLDKMIAKRMAKEEALSEQQKKRKSQVQFEAQFYTGGGDLPEQDFEKRMVDMVNQRKKHFAEEITKAKRNKPITQSQLRIYMSNYLKNQGTWKLSQLKNLSFEEIKDDLNNKKIGKRKKQKARKGISVDKNAQGDLETDKEESVEAMNPTPLATKSNIVKYGTNRPEYAYDRVLWSDLRTMFDPPLNEDAIWSLPL